MYLESKGIGKWFMCCTNFHNIILWLSSKNDRGFFSDLEFSHYMFMYRCVDLISLFIR